MDNILLNKFLLAVATLLFGALLVATDADAARLGGGRSSGMQRNYSPPPVRRAAPVVRPQAPAAAPAAAPASTPGRWTSMLGGLAIGGLLGSMFGGGGIGSGFGAFLLLALIAFGAVMLVRLLLARPQAPPHRGDGYRTGSSPGDKTPVVRARQDFPTNR